MVMNKKTNEKEKNKWKENKIGAEGANKISESLKVNTTLTELDLSGDDKIDKKMKWKRQKTRNEIKMNR